MTSFKCPYCDELIDVHNGQGRLDSIHEDDYAWIGFPRSVCPECKGEFKLKRLYEPVPYYNDLKVLKRPDIARFIGCRSKEGGEIIAVYENNEDGSIFLNAVVALDGMPGKAVVTGGLNVVTGLAPIATKPITEAEVLADVRGMERVAYSEEGWRRAFGKTSGTGGSKPAKAKKTTSTASRSRKPVSKKKIPAKTAKKKTEGRR